MPLGLFLGGCITAIPVVTGVAEGVSHQKKQNEEAANETRMIKFNLHVSCDADKDFADEVDNGILVLRHNKVRLLLPLYRQFLHCIRNGYMKFAV